MKKEVCLTRHKTKVTYSYVSVDDKRTFTETKYLLGWLNNITFITNKLKSKNKHIYSIDAIEHISVQYKMPISDFYKSAKMDLSTEKLVHKIQ